MDRQNLTLMTDLYELTMMQGYFRHKNQNETVIFDVFYRNNPLDSGYAISAGLEQVINYIKNLYTFIGNHDKARVAHFFALNMGQFYASFSPFDGSKADFERNKWAREQALMRLAGVDAVADMPLEFRLNVNNPEYFMTVSPRAIAMSTLLNDAINQTITSLFVVAAYITIFYLLTEVLESYIQTNESGMIDEILMKSK